MKPVLTSFILATLVVVVGHASPVDPDPAAQANAREAETLRDRGDPIEQRRHVWALLATLTRTLATTGLPAFESWHGEDAVFSGQSGNLNGGRGIRGFERIVPDPSLESRPQRTRGQTGDIPILTYTLFDDAAYAHIRSHRLYLRAELDRLRAAGEHDGGVPDDRSVPDFPVGARILKTAWWPVAADRPTVLPVWDPEGNPPRAGGNPYTSWQRVVVVHSATGRSAKSSTTVAFAGRRFEHAHGVDAGTLYHLRVSAGLARRLMRDRSSRKATLIALGRELRKGDQLVLVSANFAVRETRDWVWATLWWHDRPEEGPSAAERPPELQGAWRHYLLQVAFDAEQPLAADGGPHVCFDPWLEARLPDAGNGGGIASNCLACHRRASYPPIDYLPITRGAADLARDPAYAPGRLRTGNVWSIAMHARP